MATAIRAVLSGHGTLRRVARELDISPHILTNIANGRTKADTHPEIVDKLRQRFQKPKTWPFDSVSAPAIPISQNEVQMPYAGRISAGVKLNWSDPYESNDFEYVPAPMAAKGRFCCRIDGDSMMDLLQPDDLCVFQSHMSPRLGLIVLYRHHDMSATIKQLKHTGGRFILHPLNDAYPDIDAEGVCLGYLIGVVRRWGTREITVFDPQGITP